MFSDTRPSRARDWILSGLVAFAFTSYMARSNISVASESMKSALGLTNVQMGQVFTAFLIGYTQFQIVGGAIGCSRGFQQLPHFNEEGGPLQWPGGLEIIQPIKEKRAPSSRLPIPSHRADRRQPATWYNSIPNALIPLDVAVFTFS